jgi:hypothetical protein
VRLPAALRVQSVQPCDLRGRPLGEPIPLQDGAVEINRV